MTLREFVGVLENSDRMRVISAADGSDVFVGYLALFTLHNDGASGEFEKYAEYEVERFRAVPEIRHRRWKELNLMKPLSPEETPDFKFSDLQMTLYYTIYIRGGET